MIVVEMSSTESFLEELQAAENPSVVRVDLVSDSEHIGKVEYTVVCGFHDGACFYEAKLAVGADFAGGPAEAAAQAKTLVQTVKAACAARGIACRAGRYSCLPQ